jgi:hypothetical protein
MEHGKKVGLATKFLSNRNYLKEVSVEGKITNKFNFKIGFYDQYAAQIIRSGNCITLLSNNITIDKDTFWNPNYFEDLTKYVFWTFDKSFQLALVKTINALSISVVGRCENSADEELQWCFIKNEHLKKDPKFEQMYSLDKENRSALLQALAERMMLLKSLGKDFEKTSEDPVEEKTPSFLDVLTPINNNPNDTLNFINLKLGEAGFELKLLSKVDKLPNGKNPYGLNGAIAAMIDLFCQYNYFRQEYNLEEIFKAYTIYTGNSIAKLRSFLSEFRQDNSYIKHFDKLKRLKISKLKQ